MPPDDPTAKGHDPWSSSKYQAAANFVPLLTTKVVSWLDANTNDRILDLGCGDGVLTEQIARQSKCQSIIGSDASSSMIETARASLTRESTTHADEAWKSAVSYEVRDARTLHSQSSNLAFSNFTKVFSNAALHWILHDADSQKNVLRSVHDLLVPGGTFVFEMGGKGNISEIHTALISSLVHIGKVPIQAARDASPWFFPSERHMNDLLVQAGFEVIKSETEWRPTKATQDDQDAKSSTGLEGWVRLMGAEFFEAGLGSRSDYASMTAAQKSQIKNEIVQDILETLESVMRREEDGSMWMGYVRLRMMARRPVDTRV